MKEFNMMIPVGVYSNGDVIDLHIDDLTDKEKKSSKKWLKILSQSIIKFISRRVTLLDSKSIKLKLVRVWDQKLPTKQQNMLNISL